MRRFSVLSMIIALAIAGAAQAGFVNPDDVPSAAPFTCEFTNPANSHEWDFDYAMPTLTMNEIIGAVAADNVMISGETDSDPVFTVIKTITNTSGVTWTGYNLTLAGSGIPTFVAGSAGAGGGKLQNVAYPHPAAIVFSGNNPVHNGELLTLQFDINVPTTGLFDFSLTQHPVPEPTTIGLLGLGSLTLLRKRRS